MSARLTSADAWVISRSGKLYLKAFFMVPKKQRLNRFTSLPIVLDMLFTRRITLLSPRSWEDQNDSFYIERYVEKMNLKAVLALCFITGGERFHHWKLFSNGSSGVCIEFEKNGLLRGFSGESDVEYREVEYKKVEEVSSNPPPLPDWPFLKRIPFTDEVEFRVIYKSRHLNIRTKKFPLDIACIKRITLSPWLAKPVSDSVIQVIRSVPGCDGLKVNRSTLIENSRWRVAIDPSQADEP